MIAVGGCCRNIIFITGGKFICRLNFTPNEQETYQTNKNNSLIFNDPAPTSDFYRLKYISDLLATVVLLVKLA